MTKYVINGGKTLNGEVTISGAKNAAVAIVPAALLADGPVRLENVPKIYDYCSAMAFSAAFCRSVTEMVHSAFRSASVPSVESLPISTAFLPFR